jgi:hypothetical protein
MLHKITNKIVKLIHEIRARKIAFATPFVIYAFFVVDWIWLLSGFMFYWVAKSIFIATYHEYQVHKWIRPKYKFIELLGWLLTAIWEQQSPYNKCRFHFLHHTFGNDPKKDPTQAKVDLTENALLYHFDLTPHASLENLPPMPDDEVDPTPMFDWFNKHWYKVFFATILIWLITLPFWTFLAFFIFPVWIWGIIYRYTDWWWHKLNNPDPNWMVLLIGTHAWHNYHHKYSNYGTDKKVKEVYLGPKPWKYFNIDFYIQKLLYKPY